MLHCTHVSQTPSPCRVSARYLVPSAGGFAAGFALNFAVDFGVSHAVVVRAGVRLAARIVVHSAVVATVLAATPAAGRTVRDGAGGGLVHRRKILQLRGFLAVDGRRL